jgi:hypothetical protein
VAWMPFSVEPSGNINYCLINRGCLKKRQEKFRGLFFAVIGDVANLYNIFYRHRLSEFVKVNI